MTTPGEQLTDGLERLRNDPRFVGLVAGDSPLSLALWVVELDCDEGSGLRLLYGWVIRAPSLGACGFTTTDAGGWEGMGEPGKRYRFHRLVLNEQSSRVHTLIAALVDGRSLHEACAGSGIDPPPERFRELRLGADRDDVARRFSFGPVRFLPTSSQAAMEALQPMKSPSADCPAFSAALVRVNKSALFTVDGTDPLPGAHEMARRSLSHLTAETGLAFTGSDCRRLGNLEWLALLSADSRENSYVSIRADRVEEAGRVRVRAIHVEVRAGALPGGTRVLVRCRLRAGNEVSSDVCVEGQVGADFQFPVATEITRILVTIWTLEEGGVGRIWFEHEMVLIRELGLHLGVMGMQGSLESDWTDSLAKVREETRKRVDKVRALSQVSYQISGGGERASWEIAEREIEGLVRRLFPSPSGAQFFPRGWDEGGPGFLSFVEWFRVLTDDATTKTILIVDPYFDAAGVVEFLARARATQIEYVVLTNSQIASKDDPPEVPAFPPSQRTTERAIRIRSACEGTRDSLSQLRFKILDLRSRGTKADAIFHDRYVLVFAGTGELRTGYHLSNSIQGATKRTPLLITPIPSDVLEDVGRYVDSLVVADPAMAGDAAVDTIASTQMLRPKQPVGDAGGGGRIPDREVFGLLLESPELPSLDPDALGTRLRALGAIDDGGRYRFTEAMAGRFDAFVRALVALDEPTFARRWTAVGEWMARVGEGSETLHACFAERGGPLLAALERFLTAAPNHNPPEGVRVSQGGSDTLGLGHMFRRAFADVLTDAGDLLHYRDRWYVLQPYAVAYAIRIVRDLAPIRLVALAERFWDAVPVSERQNDGAPATRTALRLLGLVLDALVDGIGEWPVVSAMRGSHLPLLRAMAVQAAIGLPLTEDPAPTVKFLLHLALEERLPALAEWVYALRVAANRCGPTEEAPLRERRLLVFDQIAASWPASVDAATLRALALRLGGPGEGAWATSTMEDLFARLITDKKLRWEDVEGLWFGLLEERLGSMLSGKGSPGQQFYLPNDGPLTEAWATALVRCGQEVRERRRSGLASLRRAATRTLGAPFARSRDYSRWAEACDGVRWLRALMHLVRKKGEAFVPANELACWSADRAEVDGLLAGVHDHHRTDIDDLGTDDARGTDGESPGGPGGTPRA